MNKYLYKSIIHNLGVVIVGFIFAFLGVACDSIFKFNNFRSTISILFGIALLITGFLIRVWGTYYFYKNKMGVIKLKPQKTLITQGPFAFSRNPLYLGGNFFIFGGVVLILGTTSGVMLTVLELFLTDLMIRREEVQLEKTFGKEWVKYKNKVRRWI